MNKHLFSLIFCMFFYSSSGSSGTICQLLFSVANQISEPKQSGLAHLSLNRSVQERAKVIFGPLWEHARDIRIVNERCSPIGECVYSTFFNLVQMDTVKLATKPDLYGAVLLHELAHGVQANQRPIVLSLRRLVEISKKDLFSRSLKLGKIISNVKRLQHSRTSFFYFFIIKRHTERLIDKERKGFFADLRQAIEPGHFLEDYYLIAPSQKETQEMRIRRFLSESAGELFADLVSCAAYKNPDIHAETFTTFSHDKQKSEMRKNSDDLKISSTANWVGQLDEDIHSFLKSARIKIWHRYISKHLASEDNLVKLIGKLESHSRIWASTIEKEELNRFYDPTYGLLEKNGLNLHFLSNFDPGI